MRKSLLFFVLLLSLSLVFAFMTYAQAATVYYVYVNGVRLDSGEYLASSGSTAVTTKPSGGYAYFSAGTLELNGFSCTLSEGSAISASGDLTIKFTGSNTLRGGSAYSSAYGIYVSGKLTITGTSSSSRLTVTAGKSTENGDSIGIYAQYLTVDGLGTISSTGGVSAQYSQSYGVDVTYNLVKSGTGTLYAYGGSNGTTTTYDNRYSYGISAKYITVSGGTISATAGTGNESYGIQTSSLTITGGAVTGKGASNSGIWESLGVHCSGNVTVSGGTLTATGQSSKHSTGLYAKNITLTNGTVTATGGSTSGTADGLYSHGSWGISCEKLVVEGGKLTATGGAANYTEGWSYGIETSSYIISGGQVTATGGISKNYSSGLYASGFTASGGTTIGKGGSRAYDGNNYGIYGRSASVTGSPTITGTSYKADFGVDDGYSHVCNSYGIYFGTCNTFDINGTAAISGTAGTAKDTSCGVYLGGSNYKKLSGSATVYAKGGTADYSSYSYGISATNISLSGQASVTAVAASNTHGDAADTLTGVAMYSCSADISGSSATGQKANNLPDYSAKYVKMTSTSKITVSLLKEVDDGGTGGTVSGSGEYLPGSSVRITASAKSYYTFAGWYINGVRVSTSTSYTFNPTSSVTVTAMFANTKTPIPVPTAVAGLVYDGTIKTGVLTGTGYSLSSNTGTNAGNYTARATLRTGYVWDDCTIATKQIPWSISKAPVPMTPPEAVRDLRYTGEAQNLITVEAPADGTAYYSVNGSEWSQTIPAATDCGEYSIAYYVKSSNNNYQDLGNENSPYDWITCTISKAYGPDAPTGLTCEAVSHMGASDGAIIGTTEDMEYATQADFSDAKDCAVGRTDGLPEGTYYVRVKGTSVQEAGEAVTLVITVCAFEVKLSTPENGTLSASNETASTGSSIRLTTSADAGYELTILTVTGSDGTMISLDGDSFTMPSQDVTVNAVFSPITYGITYDLAGGEEGTNPTSYTVESAAITLTEPTKAGYVFAGWVGTELGDATKSVTIAKGSIGNRSYTATWEPAEDTAYTVKHLFENVSGTAYEADAASEQKLSGITDAQTAAVALPRTGFTAQSVSQKTIAADGSTVVEIRYSRNAYTLTFKPENGAADVTSSVKYGATITAPADPTRTGYIFAGWTPTVVATMPAADATYTATWTPAADTAYTVKHLFQNIADDSYTADSSAEQTLSGTTGEQTVAAALPYTGFTAQSVSQKTIAADGSTVVEIRYSRNAYTLTFKPENGAADVTSSVKYGATITAPADPTRTGYFFAGWTPTVAATMPAADATYTATWTPAADTAYTVKHLFQNIADDGYTADSSAEQTLSGTTGERTAAAALPRTGFTAQSVSQKTIAADGSTVVEIRYNRNAYTLTFKPENGAADVTSSVKYGATITAPADPTRTGYIFAGWTPTVAATMPAADATYTAQWTIKQLEVTYNANGGSGSMSSCMVPFGQYTLPGCGFTAPAGKQFKGWALTADGSVLASPCMLTADTEFYAIWERIPVKPVITAPTASQTVTIYEGKSATFEITARDADTYQWYISSNAGQSYAVVPGATGFSYQTDVLTLDADGISYYCVASNVYGSVQSPVFTLDVLQKIVPPGDADDSGEVNLYDALLIMQFDSGWEVTLNASKADVNGDGEVSIPDAVLVIKYCVNGDGALVLRILKDMADAYSIKILEIMTQPADQFVAVGEQANFTVLAEGDGLSYQWQVNRNDGTGWQVLNGADGATWVVAAITADYDGFQYRCLVSDVYGIELLSEPAVLHLVYEVPETGDTSKPAMWFMLCLLSALSIVFIRKRWLTA